MQPQKTPNSQSNLEKEEQSWKHHAPWFQTLQRTVIKTVWYIKPGTESTEHNREPRINPSIYDQLIYNKDPKIYNKERIVSSINGVGKIGHMEKNEIGHLLYTKINLNLIKGLNRRPETIKLVEENWGSNKLLDVSLGDDFLNLTSKAKISK